jgi:hypothetical protein
MVDSNDDTDWYDFVDYFDDDFYPDDEDEDDCLDNCGREY